MGKNVDEYANGTTNSIDSMPLNKDKKRHNDTILVRYDSFICVKKY